MLLRAKSAVFSDGAYFQQHGQKTQLPNLRLPPWCTAVRNYYHYHPPWRNLSSMFTFGNVALPLSSEYHRCVADRIVLPAAVDSLYHLGTGGIFQRNPLGTTHDLTG